MKKEIKYSLSVYIMFSIELLINIATIWFCEKSFNPKWFSNVIFNKYFNVFLIIAVIIGIIEEFFINERIEKGKAGPSILAIQIPTYVVCCILMGLPMAALDDIMKSNIILYAFWITFMIFLSTTIWGFVTKRKNYHHPILSRIFIGSCVISVFNVFWGWNWVNIIIDVIDLVVVSLFIYLNTIKIKQHAKEDLDDNSSLKLLSILMDSNAIYMNFMLIWADITDLMVRAETDSN